MRALVLACVTSLIAASHTSGEPAGRIVNLDVSTGLTGERRSGNAEIGAALGLSARISSATPSSGIALTLGGGVDAKDGNVDLSNSVASASAFVESRTTRLTLKAYAQRDEVSPLGLHALDFDRFASSAETRRELGASFALEVEGPRPVGLTLGVYRLDWNGDGADAGNRAENGVSMDLNVGLGAAWFGLAELSTETTKSGPDSHSSHALTLGIARDLPRGTGFATVILEGTGQGDRTGLKFGVERKVSRRTSIVLRAGILHLDDRNTQTGKVAWQSEILPNTWGDLSFVRAVREDAQEGSQYFTAVDLKLRRKLGPSTEAQMGLSFGRADPIEDSTDRSERHVFFKGEHALTRDISVEVGVGLSILDADETTRNAEFEVTLVRAFRTKY